MNHAHFISGMYHTFKNYGVIGMRKATPTCRKHILFFAILRGIKSTDYVPSLSIDTLLLTTLFSTQNVALGACLTFN